MSVSNIFLVSCIAAAATMFAYEWMGKPLVNRMLYDDSPPIHFLSAHLEADKLQMGAPEIKFSFTYTKRDKCHPPQSPPGLVRFRVWLKERDWVWLRFENTSYAKATEAPVTRPFRAVPLPPLQPGKYGFQWVVTYHCLNSSQPITVESPILPFEIVGNGK